MPACSGHSRAWPMGECNNADLTEKVKALRHAIAEWQAKRERLFFPGLIELETLPSLNGRAIASLPPASQTRSN